MGETSEPALSSIKGTAMSSEEVNVEAIAKVCHEVNRWYCKALGDESQPEW